MKSFIIFAVAYISLFTAGYGGLPKHTVTFEGREIPLIASVDVLVVGGTLDACFLTSSYAEQGNVQSLRLLAHHFRTS